MSQTPETSAVPTATTTTHDPAVRPVHETPRVFKAAAWVAIVAGVVFIISTIFFTGFWLGLVSGHGGGHHHKHHKHHPAMYHGPGYQNGGVPANSPGTGPGGPGGPGGPAQVPPSVSPSATPSPTPGR